MTTPDPRAWRVAIALALALPDPPDWARWASGEFATVTMVPFYPDDGFPLCEGWCIGPNDGKSTLYRSEDEARAHAVPAPWDAAAYLADCARRGVEPGPLPSLKHSTITERFKDGRIAWAVTSTVTTIQVGRVEACVQVISDGPFAGTVRVSFSTSMLGAHPDDVARIVTLVTAAAKAMVP